MKHSDFKIGIEFTTALGARIWRVTDIGTRTIIAIRVDDFVIGGTARHQVLTETDFIAKGWFNGPPYAVSEHVFDEYDIEGCEVK
jgi:hypothetical protein